MTQTSLLEFSSEPAGAPGRAVGGSPIFNTERAALRADSFIYLMGTLSRKIRADAEMLQRMDDTVKSQPPQSPQLSSLSFRVFLFNSLKEVCAKYQNIWKQASLCSCFCSPVGNTGAASYKSLERGLCNWLTAFALIQCAEHSAV